MYTFEAKYKKNDLAVLFLGQIERNQHHLAEEISECFSAFHRPDAVVLIYPSFLEQKIVSSDFDIAVDQLTRFGPDVSVYLVGFDESATLSFTTHQKGKVNYKKSDYDSIRESIVTAGLMNMASKKKESLILSAPVGTIFCKPSGETYSEFIKASELASTSHEIQFIAFSILKSASIVKDLRCVYIDTMSISSYVEALISYLTLFSGSRIREISYYSFNSYLGLDSPPEETDGVFVIISASSSNNLSRKIRKRWSISSDKIINFLSYKDAEDENDIQTILNVKYLSEESEEKSFSEKKLKIVGENFAVEASEATSVLLKVTKIPATTIKDLVYPKRHSTTFSCNKVLFNSLNEKHITVDWLQEKDEVKSWVSRVINWHIPGNSSSIIFDGSNPNIAPLLKHVNAEAKKALGRDIKTYHLGEISDISKVGAAIIVSDAISTGRGFVSINRELRRCGHSGNRIFISPFAIFESKKKFQSTKKTLEKGEPGFDYKLICKEVLFVGPKELGEVWNKELELIKKYDHQHWKTRSRHLETKSKGIGNNLGSYTSSAIYDEFTKDFAFWPGDYDTNKVNSSTVYITIACILQYLRSLDPNEEGSLNGHAYQAKILSPENFWRFNDALIQSCLWRAALYSELDYRGDSLTSKTFSDLVLKYVDEAKNGKNYIVCDYLVAIALGKVKISNECVERIVSYGRSELSSASPAWEVLASIEEKFLRN